VNTGTTPSGPHRESIGRAGEYLAGAIFEERGIRTTHVDIHHHDLWVRTPSGRRLTVQVKTTAHAFMEYRPDSGRAPRERYFFRQANKTRSNADIFCFVALDKRLLLVEDHMGPRKVYRPEAFTQEAMEASIAQHLY